MENTSSFFNKFVTSAWHVLVVEIAQIFRGKKTESFHENIAFKILH